MAGPRIASLLPSATEIVCALGLRERLVGVSHSCDHPPGLDGLPVLTRTTVPVNEDSARIDAHVRRWLGSHRALYQLDLSLLERLAPDLVVSQRLCDVCAVSVNEVEEALCALSPAPTLVDLEPSCWSDILDDIRRVADAAGVPERGDAVVSGLAARIDRIRQRSEAIPATRRPRLAVIEWLDPPFNSGHWVPELVEAAGVQDVLGPRGRPSTTIDWEEVLAADPEALLLSVCGFDIARTRRELERQSSDPGWLSVRRRVGDEVYLLDGNAYFTRPGPRVVDAVEALAHAFHPEVHASPVHLVHFERL